MRAHAWRLDRLRFEISRPGWEKLIFSFEDMLQSYLSAFQNGLTCLLIQIIVEVMVQNVMKIDTIFDQISLKFRQILSHF